MQSLQDFFNNTFSKPFVIAGPCSAESEEQMLQTAAGLQKQGITKVFRAGIWKPRTRPNAFEGFGEAALPWLLTVKEKFGFEVITEVANAHHVEKCLKYGVDAIWIGARTTVNPFSVQEIADALKGTNLPVFIKNPINPDLSLWIGAIERILKSETKNIAVIHRGFSWFDKTKYRYAPKWEMALEIKTQFPTVPLICDPSHIAGKPSLLKEVCQKALDLDINALMIETHSNPPEAKSDAQQQITPVELGQLIHSLEIRHEHSTELQQHQELKILRGFVDEIDEHLIHLLFERLNYVRKIGAYKKEHDLTILQLERWKEIMNSRTQWAKNLQLYEEFIKEFLQVIHKESIRLQTEVYHKDIANTKNSIT